MSTKPYSVYVLWSPKAQSFYTGVTEDVDHRLEQHNCGVSKWTKRHAGTWTLVWDREFTNLGQARKFENKLKKQKGGTGFWILTGLDQQAFHNTAGS